MQTEKPIKSDTQTVNSFEKNLQQLESFVENMESGELPIDSMISTYDQAMKLVNSCNSQLQGYRQRLEVLEKDGTYNKM
jgi:exodeoxyribonuclease VII small subunit